MAVMLKKLLMNEALYTEVLHMLDADAGLLTQWQTVLHINEEGNIVRVNQAALTGNNCSQLTYLIGSIGFLYNLVSSQLNTPLLPGDSKQALITCKKEIVALLIELLSELSQAGTAENIDALLENIRSKKIEIKEELGQSDFGWSLLLFGNMDKR